MEWQFSCTLDGLQPLCGATPPHQFDEVIFFPETLLLIPYISAGKVKEFR
jgi:hypothetical protein